MDYSSIGGLSEQIRAIREAVELPLLNPEIFQRVGIAPPKVRGAHSIAGCAFRGHDPLLSPTRSSSSQGVLLYGPPGTGKTLLARAIASNMDANFLKVVASAIVDKFIGESARIVREVGGTGTDARPLDPRMQAVLYGGACVDVWRARQPVISADVRLR